MGAQAIERRDVMQPSASSSRAGPAKDVSRAPIIAAVDGTDTGIDAARTGARMARELEAPLVLAYVRSRPAGWLGEPYFQRALDSEMDVADRALDAAAAAARREGVVADTEVLAGQPARRIREFANDREARLLVLGSRRRLFKRSVSRRVARESVRPVLVAGA
jgi:nucleotide-binding universal stress UspA family protein